MLKITTLLILALLLSPTLSCAARPEPQFRQHTPANTHYEGVETQKAVAVEESCEGVGEEECLARRTLAAHIDYIYTQKQKP
ncbi:hypothetical protein NMG60_11025933 [Bertholletia excelsa]